MKNSAIYSFYRYLALIAAGVVSLAFSSGQNRNTALQTMNIGHGYPETLGADFKWNDIVSDIGFIPLETNPLSAVFGTSYDFCNINGMGDICIRNEGAILIFDKNGRFLSRFECSGFCEITDDRKILCADYRSGMLKTIGLDGCCLDSLVFDSTVMRATVFYSDYYLAVNSLSRSCPHLLSLWNKKGEKIRGFLSVDDNRKKLYYTDGRPSW